MGPDRGPPLQIWMAMAFLDVAAFAAVGGITGCAVVEPEWAYAVPAFPENVDSLTSIEDAVRRIRECAPACSGIVYFWSDRMPLSRLGVANVAEAADNLGIGLALVDIDEVHDYAHRDRNENDPPIPLIEAMLRAGVLAHAPALVVHKGGELVGHAILGYKTSDTYEEMIARRLSGPPTGSDATDPPFFAGTFELTPQSRLPFTDYEAVDVPGAYFRWVPGRRALAYESGRRFYLLDLVDGESRVAAGYIDLIPSPDGRYFVTQGPTNRGLTFYDADEVFEASGTNRSGAVEPIFRDGRMRDMYPSVGILQRDESGTRYRVLTSWLRGIAYRDYDIRVDPRSSVTVRPVGEPVVPCGGMSLSTPMLSPDGLEVAARDEATGTTKIFRILASGRCQEVIDFGVPTGKVAWHQSGRKLVFATPHVPFIWGGIDGEEGGIFVFARDERRLTRVPDAEGASPLAFPDFVGDESVAFLVTGPSAKEGSFFFRVVHGIR